MARGAHRESEGLRESTAKASTLGREPWLDGRAAFTHPGLHQEDARCSRAGTSHISLGFGRERRWT